MTAALLVGPLAVFGASVMLYATTLLDRLMLAPRDADAGRGEHREDGRTTVVLVARL